MIGSDKNKGRNMDSYDPSVSSKHIDWAEDGASLPSSQETGQKESSDSPQRDLEEKSHALIQENENLMNRLSVAMREKNFTESQLESLNASNQQLTDKNAFLQDRCLVLKEKYEKLTSKNFHAEEDHLSDLSRVKEMEEELSTLNLQLKKAGEDRNQIQNFNQNLKQKLGVLSKYRGKIKPIAQRMKLENNELKQALAKDEKKILEHEEMVQILNDKLQTHLKAQKKWWHSDEAKKKQQQHIRYIRKLGDELNSRFAKISSKGNAFQKWYLAILNKKQEQWASQKEKDEKRLLAESERAITCLRAEGEKKEKQLLTKHKQALVRLAKEMSHLNVQKQSHEGRLLAESECAMDRLRAKGEGKEKQLLAENQDNVQKYERILYHNEQKMNKAVIKYKQLKTHWHKTISKIIQKKEVREESVIEKLHKDKKQLIDQLKNEIKELSSRKEKELEQLQGEHESLLKELSSRKEKELEQLQGEHESLLKELSLRKEKELEQLQGEHESLLKELSLRKEKESEEKTQNYKQSLQELSDERTQLKEEIENLNQNYTDSEREIRQKMEGDFESEKTSLLNEKQEALSKIEEKYQLLMSDMQGAQEQKLRELRDEYDLEFSKKASTLDSRIMEITEEHDDQLHNLRNEMEKELLAERRNSLANKETYEKDIEKLQKDFREIQSELELKRFKLTSLESTKTYGEKELTDLQKANVELKERNQTLQTLWENQCPEMEKQKQQIASLQQLNRQLSQAFHDESFKFQPEPSGSITKERKKNFSLLSPKEEDKSIGDLLKEIHLHD